MTATATPSYNEDITELFEETPVGAKVVVLVQPATGL
jgi:hypothetical protein